MRHWFIHSTRRRLGGARIGGTEWTTSLWPKDGCYVLPLKLMVRKAEGLKEGDVVTVALTASPSA